MFTVTLQLKYHCAPQLLSGVVSLGALSSAAQLQIVVQQGPKAHCLRHSTHTLHGASLTLTKYALQVLHTSIPG